MGGAQPLAVTINGGVALCIEVDPYRIKRRHDTGYLDRMTREPGRGAEAVRGGSARPGGRCRWALLGNAADVLPELLRRGVRVDIVTDQTSAHDELNGYFPAGLTYEEANELRERDPQGYIARSFASMARHCASIAEMQRAGSVAFDYGNNLRAQAETGGLSHEAAFSYPGFVPEYIRPLFCTGTGPFRWVALSGDPQDIAVTDAAMKELFPENESMCRWLDMAAQKVQFQGYPSRICWLGYGERDLAGLMLNTLVRDGKVKAPIVIGRDHLDAGSVASPNRETEGMRDGSDAIADWPILNALVNTCSGASWVSVHHGGGVGMGYSLHAGMVVVADGTKLQAEKLHRVLTTDPGTGVMRHADAGYRRGDRRRRPPRRDASRCANELALDHGRRAGAAPARGGRAALPAPRPGGRDDALPRLGHPPRRPDRGVRGRPRRRPGDRRDRAARWAGLVDCDTHLPFAGWRAGEYAMKVTGVPYQEIARTGGGIAASAWALAEATTTRCGARRPSRTTCTSTTTALEARPATASRPTRASCGGRGWRATSAPPRRDRAARRCRAAGPTVDAWMDVVDDLVRTRRASDVC